MLNVPDIQIEFPKRKQRESKVNPVSMILFYRKEFMFKFTKKTFSATEQRDSNPAKYEKNLVHQKQDSRSSCVDRVIGHQKSQKASEES